MKPILNPFTGSLQMINQDGSPGAGIVVKGAYNASTDYAVGDSVDYLGSSYVMFLDAAAGTLPTDTNYWQVLANKGATGSAGTNGTNGTNGLKGETGLTGNTGATGADGPNNITTSTTTNLTGFIKGNGSVASVDNSTYSTDIHSNITALNAVTNTNTGDQDLSGKVDKVTGSRLITSAESTIIGNTSNTNSGDNATNTQYSGLATSKADIASPSLTGVPLAPTAGAGTSTTQIATTEFVQVAVRSSPGKEASEYATIVALPAIIYANGSSGVGATLTGVAFGALGVDSQSPAVGNRILVKNQVSTFQNGIYTVTATGSGVAVFVLTRALDFNQQTDILTGASTYVVGGTTLAATTWDVNSADSPVIGTDAITFVQSAGPGSVVQGNGITITGTSIAINTAVTADLTSTQTMTGKTIDGVTPTIMGYVDPTSSIQTQLNGKQTSGTYSTDIHGNITALNAVSGTNTGDNASNSSSLPIIGGTMSGNIVMADGGTIGQVAGPLIAFDDTNNYLEITGGNVGIGTMSPGAKLTIAGGANDANTETIRFNRTEDGARFNSIYSLSSATAGNSNISFLVHNSATSTSQTTVMTLKGSGNVGIGTTSPSFPLHVVGSTYIGINSITGTDVSSVNYTLSNTDAINSTIPRAFALSFTDSSTNTRLSNQIFRFTYAKSATSTGEPTAFDAMMCLTPVFNASQTGPLRGVNLEGPIMAAGKTLTTYTAMQFQPPTGTGTVTNIKSIQIDSGAGLMTIGTNGLTVAGSVGIGVASPNANAILDVTSTTKAFMPPRMTTTQKNAIATPTSGMMVYDSTINKLCVYGASSWETIQSGYIPAGWGL